jgi:peptidoglycan/xylan/chitin deacetylase (PgdA/CDA1 family)
MFKRIFTLRLLKKLILLLTIITTYLMIAPLRIVDAEQEEIDAPGDRVVVPIILYHHIRDGYSHDRYSVSIEDFSNQMALLRKYGYQTITTKQLVDHLVIGRWLPQRPIIITFDDGYEDVYLNAYPLMENYGFTGVVYIVSDRLYADGFLKVALLKDLLKEGWEIGSHSITHADLVNNHNSVRQEVLQSKLDLEKALGTKVYSFAYPFGLTDPYVTRKVYEYGYKSGMGVGVFNQHSLGSLYNLSRREVQGSSTLKDFKDLLPWTGFLLPKENPKFIMK